MLKTNPVANREQPKRHYIKPAGLVLTAGICSQNGIYKNLGNEPQKVLHPLDDKFFAFLSKMKLGKKLTNFLNSTNLKPQDRKTIGSLYSVDPKLMLKGAGFGVSIYVLAKLIKMAFVKREERLDRAE